MKATKGGFRIMNCRREILNDRNKLETVIWLRQRHS